MFEQTIRRLLSMFPRGMTSEQLVWRLRRGGVRVTAEEMSVSLRDLSDKGELACLPGGRWMLREFNGSAVSPGTQDTRATSPTDESGALLAMGGRCRPKTETEEAVPGLTTDETTQPRFLPEWGSLLGYYAATLRRDPRGRIAEFPDRHGTAWQLFRTEGHWWTGSNLHFAEDRVPPSLLEALTRREVPVAALGYPLTVFAADTGMTVLPALLVPAEWTFAKGELVISPTQPVPALNPEWLREVRRRTIWTETALVEHLFPEGEEADLGVVARRLRRALATLGGGNLRPGELAGEMTLGGEGFRNAAAIFLPDDHAFTRRAADDVDAIANWPPESREGTALAALLEDIGTAMPEAPPLLSPAPLTDTQRNAAESALERPVTVIQGPPGTGKSQVIVSLLVSAVLSGRTVLFAARNHQAVDEVERRLRDLVPDAPLLTRGRDAGGERDTSFLDALRELAEGDGRPPEPEPDLAEAKELGRRLEEARRATKRLEELHLALCEHVDRLSRIREHLSDSPRQTWGRFTLPRLISWLLSWLRRRRSSEAPLEELPRDASIAEIERRIQDIRSQISEHENHPEFGPEEEARLLKAVADGLRRLAGHVTIPEETERQTIAARVKELAFDNVRSARQLDIEDAQTVLRHRPIWAISTLSVPARVPLIRGLFDYVIFDEASQGDIASAIPPLARARRAVVVGDPMQLTFIPGLGNAQEHALMDAHGLPKTGRAGIAQSVNSLFEFCAARPLARRFMLRDQFRSAPEIVDYLNEDFYGGRLIPRRDDDNFRPPKGFRPGLDWRDIKGRAGREEGGTVNRAEAEAVVAVVRQMALDRDFEGSVGVISPFNAQVALIERTARKEMSESERERIGLRISTVDRFQGGEADVVVFSPVIAIGAPHSALTFLRKERRRVNVAISRARALCLVVGDLEFAKSSSVRHIANLARRASTPWSPPRPPFDSLWERRLYEALRSRGLEPIPQYPVGTRYLDLAIDPEGARLDVEVDGRRWHMDPDGNRKVADRLRDSELQARGWKVQRFWVHELAENMEKCVERIERELGRQ